MWQGSFLELQDYNNFGRYSELLCGPSSCCMAMCWDLEDLLSPVHSAGPWSPPQALPHGLPPALPHFFCSGTMLYNCIQEHNGRADPQAETGNRPCEEKSQL